MTGRKIKLGRLVLSTCRQPAGAPLLDSCTVIEREEDRTFVDGRWFVREAREKWRAHGYAIRLFTPPYEVRPLALTVSVIGAPLPPSGPMMRARLRGLRRRAQLWPMPTKGLGRLDDLNHLDAIRDFCGRS
ncbi:MAG TPA: hypothetical protein VF192_00970 [Longimicrobiales bacterium]